MIQIIAHGLDIGHPAAYFMIFLIIGMPLLELILVGGALIIEILHTKKEDKNRRY